MMPLFLLIAASSLLFALASPATATETREFILSNGMKVLLVEAPKAPVVTVQVWYKVGSRNEVMGRAGLSHMLEHMMFKGTVKYPKGTFSRLIRKNGGIDNAFTSQDFTAYFENLAADRVELALEMEADRMQGLVLDMKELTTEREVVKEERRLRTEDDPQGALVEALFAQAYLSHPYHWPVIGWFNDLDAMTLDDLQQHYDTYYSPNNATLIVVGDIKADSLLPAIKQLFEPIPRGPEPRPIATMEPEQKGERRFLLKRDAQVAFVMMGYRVPNFSSEDSYALDILDSILSHGKSSRLYQSLVYEQKSALAVGAEYSLLQSDPGLFYFYALVSPNQKPELVEKSLNREIKRLQTDLPTELELQRAKNQVEASHIFEQDSNFRRAMLLGQAESVGAGWQKIDQFVERIRAVTAKDIQRVARQYLTEDNRTVGTLIPVPPKQPGTPSSAARQGKP
ncbi:MAG: insulinase family protein [Nitrospira sp.]|jgi:zinc protease|nr:insulinase family protein [Nitrospira sp.]MBP0121274.1 insulinase family protein [Nitrospira sp.]MBP0124739.1 insulinase family protein [Nitrospira sp.]MBP0126957.1 insulinase family protein [Nitrospira sp.]MBP0130119.1 insulinase family protein [Nitrospira sp.]